MIASDKPSQPTTFYRCPTCNEEYAFSRNADRCCGPAVKAKVERLLNDGVAPSYNAVAGKQKGAPSDNPMTDRIPADTPLSTVRIAWKAGYQTAIDSLRVMKDEFADEQVQSLVGVLADTLERMKPLADD